MSPPKRRPLSKKRPGLKTKKQADPHKMEHSPSLPLVKSAKKAAASKEKLKIKEKPSRVSLRLMNLPPPAMSPERGDSDDGYDFPDMERPETPEQSEYHQSPEHESFEMPTLDTEGEAEPEMESPDYEPGPFYDVNEDEDEPVASNNSYIEEALTSSNVLSESEIDSLNVSLYHPSQLQSQEEVDNRIMVSGSHPMQVDGSEEEEDESNENNEFEQSSHSPSNNDVPLRGLDPVQLGRSMWRNVMSRTNYITTIRRLEEKLHLQEKKWRRDFMRVSIRTFSLLQKFEAQNRALERQVEPLKRELAELKAARLNDMITLEAHSTRQVSEAMLNYQSELKSTLKTPAEKTVTMLHHRESERMIMRLRNRIKTIAMTKPNETITMEARSDPAEEVSREEDKDIPDNFKYEDENVETMSNDSADEENLGNASDLVTSGAEHVDEDQGEYTENEDKPSYSEVEERAGEQDGEVYIQTVDYAELKNEGSNNVQYEILLYQQNEVDQKEVDQNEVDQNEVDQKEVDQNEVEQNEVDQNEVDQNEVDQNEVETQELRICETAPGPSSDNIGGLSASDTENESEVVPKTNDAAAQSCSNIHSGVFEHLQLSQSDTDSETATNKNERGMPSKTESNTFTPPSSDFNSGRSKSLESDTGEDRHQPRGMTSNTEEKSSTVTAPPGLNIVSRPSQRGQVSQSDTDGESMKFKRQPHGMFSNTEDEADLVGTILSTHPDTSTVKQRVRVPRKGTAATKLKPMEEMEKETLGQDEDIFDQLGSNQISNPLNNPQPTTSNVMGMGMNPMNMGMPMAMGMAGFPFPGLMNTGFQQQTSMTSASILGSSPKVTPARSQRRSSIEYPTVRAIKKIPDSSKKKHDKPSFDSKKAKFFQTSESESESGTANRGSFSRLATKRQSHSKLETINKKVILTPVPPRVHVTKLTSTSESELEAKKQNSKSQLAMPSRIRGRQRRDQPTSESDALSDLPPLPSEIPLAKASTSIGGGFGNVKLNSAKNIQTTPGNNNEVQLQQEFPQQISPSWPMPGSQGMFGQYNMMPQMFQQGSSQFGPPFMPFLPYGPMGGGNFNQATAQGMNMMFQQSDASTKKKHPQPGASGSKNKDKQQQASFSNFPMQGMNFFQPQPQGGNPGMMYPTQQGPSSSGNNTQLPGSSAGMPMNFQQQVPNLMNPGFQQQSAGTSLQNFQQQKHDFQQAGRVSNVPGKSGKGKNRSDATTEGGSNQFPQLSGMSSYPQQMNPMAAMGYFGGGGMNNMVQQASGMGPMFGLPVPDSEAQVTKRNTGGDEDSEDSDSE